MQTCPLPQQRAQGTNPPKPKRKGRGAGMCRREGASEAAPEAGRQAVKGGCQSGWGRLLLVTNAVEAGTWRQTKFKSPRYSDHKHTLCRHASLTPKGTLKCRRLGVLKGGGEQPPEGSPWSSVRVSRQSKACGCLSARHAQHPQAPPPLCDIPSGCCSFTGPWTVTRSSLRILRRVAAFWRPLRPVLLLVSFPRSRSPVVGVLGLC